MDMTLPPYDKVFFVHYQCDEFGKGTRIHNLSINVEDNYSTYQGNEEESISNYCKQVNKFCKRGLTPVHWNQNRIYFGVEHIVSRYKELTGKSIRLNYPNGINLSGFFYTKYGPDYVPNPRLDNLARLLNSYGIRENELNSFTYPTDRIKLIVKIYKAEVSGVFGFTPLPATSQAGKAVPKPPQRLIVFNKDGTIDLLFEGLKGFFPNRETDLKSALQGNRIDTPLLFPHNQNKFVEVFRRLKYNSFITSTPTEIKEWLCTNFQFRFKKGKIEEIRDFNKSTVLDILTKGKGEPPKKERICQPDWLPYKSPDQLQAEAQKEKI